MKRLSAIFVASCLACAALPVAEPCAGGSCPAMPCAFPGPALADEPSEPPAPEQAAETPAPAPSPAPAPTGVKKKVPAPAQPKLLKARAGSGSVSVKWRAASGARGYQLLVARSKDFRTGMRVKSVAGSKRTKAKISGLRRGKRYYVRVRAYRIAGGESLCSKWSAVKRVLTR